jgi:hypothetical protein
MAFITLKTIQWDFSICNKYRYNVWVLFDRFAPIRTSKHTAEKQTTMIAMVDKAQDILDANICELNRGNQPHDECSAEYICCATLDCSLLIE